jgi:hypothetical protein
MHIAEFTSSQNKLYCPITGQLVYNNGIVTPSSALMGFWHNEIIDMPQIFNKDFETDWQNHFTAFEHENENDTFCSIELEEFFKAYSKPHWLTISLKTTTLACGPVENTVWFIFDMETEGPMPEGYY